MKRALGVVSVALAIAAYEGACDTAGPPATEGTGGGVAPGGDGGTTGNGGTPGSGGAALSASGGAVGAGGVTGSGGRRGSGASLGTAEDPFGGTQWEIRTEHCSVVLRFINQTYSYVNACLPVGTFAFDIQEEDGTFSVTGDQMTTSATASSCTNVIKDGVSTVTINGDVLTVVTGPSRLVFNRVISDVPRAFVGTFGCYDDVGNFSPSPLLPI